METASTLLGPATISQLLSPARLLTCSLLLATLLFSNGCSTFNRDWRKATVAPVPGDTIHGPWQGTWRSNADGHHDTLRCLIEPRADGRFDARFKARYKRFLTFSYTAVLDVQRTNGVFHFKGQADLGEWAGGVYRYEGKASPTQFSSSYRSKYDHGIFEMSRPKGR